MEKINQTNEKLITIVNFGYTYLINLDNDIIVSAKKGENDRECKDVIGETFESFYGITALQYIKNKKSKKNTSTPTTNTINKDSPPPKIIIKKDSDVKNKTKSTNDKKSSNAKSKSNKNIYFSRFKNNLNPIFQEKSCENILADYISGKTQINKKSKDFIIISTFKDFINTDILKKNNYILYEISPKDNIAFIQVTNGKGLIYKRNPFFPFNMSFILEKFKNYIDILIIPTNEYIMSEAIKSNKKINVIIPNMEKEKYMEIIKSSNHNFRKTINSNYERFISEAKMFSSEYFSNCNIIECKDSINTIEDFNNLNLIKN